jgi:hypothetical protein
MFKVWILEIGNYIFGAWDLELEICDFVLIFPCISLKGR